MQSNKSRNIPRCIEWGWLARNKALTWYAVAALLASRNAVRVLADVHVVTASMGGRCNRMLVWSAVVSLAIFTCTTTRYYAN